MRMSETRSTIISPRVVTVLSDTTEGDWLPLRDGILSAASLHVHDAGVPRGRIYAVIEIANSDGDVLMVPWSAYATSSGAPTCAPRVKVFSGWKARVVATQTGRGSATTLHAHLFIEPEGGDVGGGSFFYEAPGEGEGELVIIQQNAPAAGSLTPGRVTVGAKTWQRVKGAKFGIEGGGGYTASAVAGNRLVALSVDDGANAYIEAPSGGAITASQNPSVSFSIGIERQYQSNTFLTGTLPDWKLAPGHRWAFIVLNRDAGDQWQAGFVTVEEWAVP